MAKKIANRIKSLELPASVGESFGATLVEQDHANLSQALETCGLDWETGIRKVCMSDKQRTPIPGYYATYRTDTNRPLGLVRGRYRPVHNREAFEWIDRVLKDPKWTARIAMGGTIHEGEKVFVGVDLGESEIFEGETLKRFLVVINSNDGGSNYTIHLLNHRPATMSILNIHDPRSAYKVRHTQGALLKLSDIEKMLRGAEKQFEDYAKVATKMARTKASEDVVDELIYRALDVPASEVVDWAEGTILKQPQWVNQHKAILEILESGPGADIAKGRVWAVYNAIITYFDHVRVVRGKDKRPDVVRESKMTGYSANAKFLAYQICRDFVTKPKAEKAVS